MFINMTPHTIVIRTPEQGDVTLLPSGTCPRVIDPAPGKSRHFCIEAGTGADEPVTWIEAVPMTSVEARRVAHLPSPEEAAGNIVVVSTMVLEALPGALGHEAAKEYCDVGAYFAAPDTGPGSVIRNDKGHVEAVTRLKYLPW